jgi:excisionase family DNA binding protein
VNGPTRSHKHTYSPLEVIPLLGISRASVYRRLEDGTIPSIRVGRLYRIPVEAFHRAFSVIPRPRR